MWLKVNPDGEVDRIGVVTPTGTKLVKRRAGIVVIKVPGHTYWAGRFMDRGYAKAEFEVYRVLDIKPDGMLKVELVTNFDVKS